MDAWNTIVSFWGKRQKTNFLVRECSRTPTISPPPKKNKAMEWDGIQIHVRKMMVSVLFVNPKNHGISKLVVWRSK